MPDIQYIKDILLKAGLVPSILILGGFLYAFILLLVVLYYFFLYVIKVLVHRKR